MNEEGKRRKEKGRKRKRAMWMTLAVQMIMRMMKGASLKQMQIVNRKCAESKVVDLATN